MKESTLISKAKKGDSEAFGQLYDTYMPAIYRFVLVKTSNKAEAEDITHQVFLKAWRSMPNYKDQGHPFSSWLYRIAQNKVIDFYRTSRSHRDIDKLPEDLLKSDTDLEDRTETLLQARFVRSVMEELDNVSRDVLLLRFVNDLSHKEIGATLGKSEGAIRVIQHRALKQVRTYLEKRHESRTLEG